MATTATLTLNNASTDVTVSTGGRGPAGSDANVTQANITSAITDDAQFRADIGLGTAATANAGAFDVAGAAATAQAASLQKSSNLSDLTSASTARTNLGLGNAATLTVDADLATFSLPANTTISTFGASLVDDADASAARTTLGLGTAATLTASQNGGALTVPQFDSSGNLRFSGSAATGSAGSIGGVFFQDTQRLWFLNTARTDGGSIFFNTAHDAFGGELQINSQHRTAICLGVNGALQIGLSLTDSKQYAYMQHRGAATAINTTIKSIPLYFAANYWNGTANTAAPYPKIQAVPDGVTGRTFLNIYNPATVPNEAGGDGTETLAWQLSESGVWESGKAPTFTTLSDGATITQTCSIYKTVQAAKVTLGGNRTLAISGAAAGMRGVIYVAQDATGGRTLTLPTGSATATDWALSTIGSRIDKLEWEYDGTYYYWTMVKGIEVAADADASAFYTAASITDPTQRSAINNLVIGLKNNSLWTKIYALYPFVGGNATAHSKDLKAAYNITWNGTPTHDSNGVTGNGTDAWGNTGFTYSAVSALNSASMYVYCRTQTPTDGRYFMGAVSTSPSTSRWGMFRSGANFVDGGVQTVAPGYFTVGASTDFRRHLALNRSGANDIQAYLNATSSSRTDGPVGVACSQPVGILARNFVGSGADNFSNANLALAMMGQSFTSGEWTTFRSLVDTFQSTLGRANP